ncbi:TetR/AcrR family transcriptional regulator [Streptomyces melanosporofaciens]|uniref:DNA-binding transcriptional regulator, AcrR family n=1 Tax=Streptomyces melanosporofaciens TaxID=67327 RepID=A0A1H5CAU5_STRMJ|nr:TetR/AcrR family transcriptional regulator [Streptomyces melanosporofaciens]SED63430.1 DNA-binding transcriptional regulator, AcrR family [Streptomyces melanosporofaciens]
MTRARAAGGSPRRPGRPRLDADEQILSAALALLAEEGFQRLTIAAIADRAGVSKPAIYRRWSGKAEVVAAAIANSHRDRPDPVGDLRQDLAAELHDVRITYERTVPMAMVGTLLAEERHHPELIAAWRRWVVEPRRERIASIITRAVDDGELSPDTDAPLMASMLIGAFYGGYTQNLALDDGWEQRVVTTLLDGARRHASVPSPDAADDVSEA